MTGSENNKTMGSVAVIGLAATGGAAVGFFLQLLVAFHFGAASDTDAYFMALSTSEMMGKLLMGGSITAVFLPMFVERLTRGRKSEAWALALNVFHLMAIGFLVLVVLLGMWAAPFVKFIAPGFDEPTYRLTVALLRVLLPSFMLLFLVELMVAMLHSLKQFVLPALLRIVAPLISIATVILLVKSIGIYSLALGVVVGSVVQVIIVAAGLKKQGLKYSWLANPFDPAIKKLLYLVYPFVFSVLMTQGAGIVYRILVSDLETGSLSALKYAEKITQLLTIIFLNSVTIVIFPLLAKKAGRKDFLGIRDTISDAIRLIVFVTVPLIMGVIVLRKPLISFIYERGSFSADDAALTSLALMWLVIGLTTNGIGSVFGHTALAMQKTRAAVAVSISSQAVAIALFVLLVPKMAVAGLALSSSLVPIVITLLYFIYLTQYIPGLITVFWHRTYLKTAVLAGVMTGVVWWTQGLISAVEMQRQISLALQLLLPTIFGVMTFAIGAWLWRIPEMNQILSIIRGKFNSENRFDKRAS